MEALGAIGLLYLTGTVMENSAQIGKTVDPKAPSRNVHQYTRDDEQRYIYLFDPDHWRTDVKQQRAIIEDATYYTKTPNVETLHPFMQALQDQHYPGQFPHIVPANYEVFGQQPTPFYPVDYNYSTPHHPDYYRQLVL